MTQPETLPCPNPECGSEVHVVINGHAWAACSNCGYLGPSAKFSESLNSEEKMIAEAIRLHNLICSHDKPEAEAAPDPSEIPTLAEIRELLNPPGAVPVAPPLPSDKLRGLVRKWRDESIECSEVAKFTLLNCALELEQLSQEPSSGEAQVELAAREIAAAQYAYAHHNWEWKNIVIGISDDAHIAFMRDFPSKVASPVTDGGKK